jgi:hypothetical protein
VRPALHIAATRDAMDRSLLSAGRLDRDTYMRSERLYQCSQPAQLLVALDELHFLPHIARCVISTSSG